MSCGPDYPELAQTVRAIWERNAAWWDEQMGEGNAFQKVLVGPATERLLQPQPGEYILDLACGNGVFSRRLASLGARVLACDISSTFLDRARARTVEPADQLEFRLVDASDQSQLLDLGQGQFDAVVCGMALMDIAVISPLLSGVHALLKPAGRFVFSVSHPCFNTTGCSLVLEREDCQGELRYTQAVKVNRYLALGPEKGIGIPGQPEPQYYFDRPLNVLFGACFAAGFVLTGLEEPAFVEGSSTKPANALSWENYRDIPPIMVARLQSASHKRY